MKVVVTKDYTEMCKLASLHLCSTDHIKTGQRVGSGNRLHSGRNV